MPYMTITSCIPQGFKHKLFVVQVAAYNAWNVLITNFSIDMSE